MHGQGEARLLIVFNEKLIHHLFLLMQNGFSLKIHAGCSLHAFLTEQMGLSPDYIEERIQTIFLDGKPVDELDAAIIRDGSSLALSGAMPGLVGAAMRRGGFYGQLRSTITYQPPKVADETGEGIVHMKIFNVLMREMGPEILKKGILVPPEDLAGFLSYQPGVFWEGCLHLTLDGETTSRDLLLREGGLLRYEMIHLTVETEP